VFGLKSEAADEKNVDAFPAGRQQSPTNRSQSLAPPMPIIKKSANSAWQDLETRHIDRGLLFAFPALFALFNAIYWSFVINGGRLSEE
jgi:hypothetical protein